MSRKKKKSGQKKKGSSGSSRHQDLTPAVIAAFKREENRPMNYKQLLARMGLHKPAKGVLQRTLEKMIYSDLLDVNSRGKYRLVDFTPGELTGVLQVTRRGVGYLLTDQGEDDVVINPKDMGAALDGDTVAVTLKGKRSGQPAGRVAKVLQRAATTFVGVIQISDRYAFVVPSNQRIHVDFFVLRSNIGGAKNGQKVIVEMTGWPDDSENPTGKVVAVLGNPGDHEVEMHAIMAEFGLPMEFKPSVQEAADKVDTQITPAEIKRRRDFRKATTFTIDPVDAKDFDDALSVEFLKDGVLRVGIHIADVSHYVQPGDILDKEAYQRATSVYLVDRVVPMLPEVLSNLVCSLRPEEEKLCFSAVFDLDENAAIKAEWFGRTVIRSDHRFTYEAAQEVLDAQKGPYLKELNALLSLSKIMRKARTAFGAIEFGGSEVRFDLDENGKPIGVQEKKLQDTNRLIEDFMLLANQRVAMFVSQRKPENPVPFVYRVHKEPDEDKLTELRAFAQRFGHEMKAAKNKSAAFAITELLRNVAGKPEENLLRHMAIRSMAKAVYSTQNIGHYGLGFQYYTHFTSPIRRYPDVMVHRVLERVLEGETGPDQDTLESSCRHCSLQERKASEAERMSIKYKQVEFMMDHVGEVFEGIVSGLTNWGIFVVLNDNSCEGMINLQQMDGDYYVFDEERYRVVGKRTKTVFEIGDPITVHVVRGDLVNLQIDFDWVP